MSISSGDGQVGPTGQPLAAEIVGRYQERGNLQDVNCIFEIESGGGKLLAPNSADLGENPGDRIWEQPASAAPPGSWALRGCKLHLA